MRAAVYRHVEGRQTLGGLTLNGFIAVLGVAFAAIQLLSTLGSVLAIAGVYAALRIAGAGRPPLFWQHLVVWHVRCWWTGGRLSAAARGRIPQLPLGPYASRDVRRLVDPNEPGRIHRPAHPKEQHR